jgi:hypothetical protein
MNTTPNFAVKEEVKISMGLYDHITLEAGTFVRPIELKYIPKHVIEDKRWSHFNNEKEVFCYTPKGILPIDRTKVIKV